MTKKFSRLLNDRFEIYVVNDGSIDNTSKIIDSLNLNNLFQLKCKGPTVRENLAQMFLKYGKTGDLIFFMDADLSTDMGAIPRLFKEIEKGYEIVIGSRYLKESQLKRRPYRFVVSKIFNLFLRIWFGSRINDHECGFKLFKAEIIKDLINDMGWNLNRRAFWDSEMLIRAQMKNYSIKEVPVAWVEGPKSYISIKKEKTILPYVIKLKFRLLKEQKK